MVELLKEIAKAIKLFFILKNYQIQLETIQSYKKRRDEIISQIEKLRAAGDSNSADKADLLFSELAEQRRIIEHLSTFNSQIKGESTDKNS